jgi:hypothetical protein
MVVVSRSVAVKTRSSTTFGQAVSRKQVSAVRQAGLIGDANEIGNIAPLTANMAVNGPANIVHGTSRKDGWRDNQSSKLKLHH